MSSIVPESLAATIAPVGLALIAAFAAGYLLSYPTEWLYNRRCDRIAADRAAVLRAVVAEERRMAA
jgi:predicted PurR-regulated permease PerM